MSNRLMLSMLVLGLFAMAWTIVPQVSAGTTAAKVSPAAKAACCAARSDTATAPTVRLDRPECCAADSCCDDCDCCRGSVCLCDVCCCLTGGCATGCCSDAAMK